MSPAVWARPGRVAGRWVGRGKAMFVEAMADNLDQMAGAVRAEGLPPSAPVLDLGCWDARNTFRYGPGDLRVFGVEDSSEAGKEADGGV